MSRTGTIAQLFNHAEEPVIHMSADDMMRRLIKDGDIVKVSNKRAAWCCQPLPQMRCKLANVYPMHWAASLCMAWRQCAHAACV